LLRINKNR